MRILIALSVTGMCLTVGQAWAEGCPSEANDGMQVTVGGTIVRMGHDDTGYGFLTKECENLVILAKRQDGCHVGGNISATGQFFSCEASSHTACTFDALDDSSISCR